MLHCCKESIQVSHKHYAYAIIFIIIIISFIIIIIIVVIINILSTKVGSKYGMGMNVTAVLKTQKAVQRNEVVFTVKV